MFGPDTYCYVYIKYIRCPWWPAVWMFILYVLCMSRIQWWWGTRGQITCMLFLMCYTACSTIHVYVACMQLASFMQNFSSDPISAHVCNGQVQIELYCSKDLVCQLLRLDYATLVICSYLMWKRFQLLFTCSLSTLNFPCFLISKFENFYCAGTISWAYTTTVLQPICSLHTVSSLQLLLLLLP